MSINQHMEFEAAGFTESTDMIGAQFFNESRDPGHAH